MNKRDYKFELEYTFADKPDAELERQLTLLITTPVGTMPLARDFGLSQSFLDRPSELAKSVFTAELTEKVARFIPEVRVQAVEWNAGADGTVYPKVVITNA